MYNGWSFLWETWRSLSPLDEGSVLLLFAMFVWSALEGVERAWFYRAAVRQSRSFIFVSKLPLALGDWQNVLVLAAARNHSHVATVFSSGLREYHIARLLLTAPESIRVAQRAARIARNSAHERLRQGLSMLGTIATTAPLIGFFGTIVGILHYPTRGYAMEHATLIAMTANSIAEALVCTGAGILVAVPAFCLFHWWRDRLSVLDAEMDITYLELAKYLQRQT